MSEMRIFDQKGKRLYLNETERQLFLSCAKEQRSEIRTLAETLAYTGCRISEALELTPNSIERTENRINFRSLKKRRDDVYRSVPVPKFFIETLTVAHQLIKIQNNKVLSNQPLWKWSRQHSYELIKKLMIDAGIADGKHRTPKGLRHAYGVNAIANDIPINMLQKWMGHSDMNTTAIYTNALGKEEIDIAKKMWE